MKYKIGDIGFMNVNDVEHHYENKPCKIYNIYNGAFKHPYAVEFIIGGKRGTLCISDYEFKLKCLNINKHYKEV